MSLKSLNIFLIAFIAWPWTIIDAQQYASLQLDAYNDTFLIAVNDESFITEGDVAEDSVVLIDFNGGETIHMDFIIDTALESTDDIYVSLEDTSGNIYYGYKVSGGDIIIEDIEGSVPLGVIPGSNLTLEIVRCGDHIFYIHESEVILCREVNSNLQFNGHVQVFEALDADVDIGISSGMECDYICEQIQENFLALENFIEWREHVITEPEIRFKYVEKYAMPDDNEEITCSLIDNATGQEVLAPFSMHNNYGINLHTWNISTADLTTGAIYIFRVSGMNKGRIYQIRIRYDGE